MVADVLDWGTHPYATAKEEGSTLMLFIYRVQEKSVPSKRKTCTSTELRNRGRPVWKPSGIGTVQLMGPSNM